MTKETIFTNAQIVQKGGIIHGTLVVRDGHIGDIAHGGTAAKEARDMGQDFLIPGLVELHTDNLERHIQPRPEVNWPHINALFAHDAELASVGITTVFDAMRVGSLPSSRARHLKYARQLSKELLELDAKKALKISHFLHLRAELCSTTLVEELAEFNQSDRVGLVSLMDHTPDQRQFRDMAKFKSYVTGKSKMNDAEFDAHVVMLKRIHAEFADIHRKTAIAEARRLGAVLASHDDTTPAHVDDAKAWGGCLSEFPTTYAAACACRAAGLSIMVGAPNLMRGGSHSGNVAAMDLAKAGLLDIVSSDYVPSALLGSAFLLGQIWGDIAKGVATVTHKPAAAVSLTDRGQLRIGLRADICRVRLFESIPMVRETYVMGKRVA